MNGIRIAIISVAFIVVSMFVVFGLNLFGLQLGGIIKEERAKIDRAVFEQSPSYVRGQIERLEELRIEYIQANPAQQQMLKTVVLEMSATTDSKDLPEHLAAWLDELRS